MLRVFEDKCCILCYISFFWISVSVKYTYDTCISIIRIHMKYQDRSQNWDFSYPDRILVRIQDFRENEDGWTVCQNQT